MKKTAIAKKLLAGVPAAVLALGLGPAAAQSLVISNWDGYMPADMAEQFEADTGISIDVANHATNEEIMGKVTASGGKGYDVIFVSSPFAEALDKLGIAAKLDHSMLPNMENLYPEARELSYDEGLTFSMPYAWGTTGLCYRSDLVSEEPDSWMDLLDPSDDLAGKVTMLSTDRWMIGAAALAKGYSVNVTDEDKLAEVKDLLISAKQDLLAYDDTTFYSKLVSGEASLVHAWDGWCNYGIAENSDIKYTIPSEGTDLWVDTMVVMASSENKEAAHEFINYILGADTHKWVVENILYKVPNKASMEALDASMIETYPNLGMDPGKMLEYEMLRDVGNAQKDYSRLKTEVMSAQ
ncbi:polyamine ABC transporter substrate-binding protein [Roseovarius indicus]|uniref:polyamine ABC transporter substrate-binding protein n=1 Tax=Roseovarius indicus TaxID=540747 RepID=UPI0007D8E42B|nr:spermidine/putrescine ABC transporter substrate-binding protein [Roseovarius indicus]OAO08840.1 spermidine/putrescine ABC transporter substrate-binding protein [Roseovarius indicus]